MPPPQKKDHCVENWNLVNIVWIEHEMLQVLKELQNWDIWPEKVYRKWISPSPPPKN